MITAVEIANFKGIRARTRFELKPVTLLFGPNSAGKPVGTAATHWPQRVRCRWQTLGQLDRPVPRLCRPPPQR